MEGVVRFSEVTSLPEIFAKYREEMHLREGSRDLSVIVLLFSSTEKDNRPVIRSAEGQVQGGLRLGLTKCQGLW